jgi:hypothetical protein
MPAMAAMTVPARASRLRNSTALCSITKSRTGAHRSGSPFRFGAGCISDSNKNLTNFSDSDTADSPTNRPCRAWRANLAARTRASRRTAQGHGLVRAVRTGRKATTTGKTAAMAIEPVGVPGSKLLENDPGGRDPASKSATRTGVVYQEVQTASRRCPCCRLNSHRLVRPLPAADPPGQTRGHFLGS